MLFFIHNDAGIANFKQGCLPGTCACPTHSLKTVTTEHTVTEQHIAVTITATTKNLLVRFMLTESTQAVC
jgi:hypothetical protein